MGGWDPAERTGIPRWVKVLGIAAAVVVLLVLVMMLAGGGGHSPPDHGGGGVDTGSTSTVAEHASLATTYQPGGRG